MIDLNLILPEIFISLTLMFLFEWSEETHVILVLNINPSFELLSSNSLIRIESLGELVTGLTDCKDLLSKDCVLSLSKQQKTTFASGVLRTLNLFGDVNALNSKPPTS